MEDNCRTKIVIIGAGIAGLGAARVLCRHPSLDVSVLEATERIGGRIRTESYGDGIIEIGAQWIHGQGLNPVYQLAREHGLTDEPEHEWEQWEDAFYMQNGSCIDPAVVKEMCLVLDDFSEDAEEPEFDGQNETSSHARKNVEEFLREKFDEHVANLPDSEKLRAQKEAILRWYMAMEKTENGCPGMHDLSLRSWMGYEDFDGREEVELKTGYRPVLDVMMKDIPRDVFRLGTRVKRIFWQQPEAADTTNPISIYTSSGDVIGADHVIVTCSLGFLKEHSNSIFYPPLPEEKMGAIHNLGFGTVNKIYLQFERPFWDKDVTGIQLMWDHTQPFFLNCLDNKDCTEKSQWFKGIHGFDVVERQTNLLCGWLAGTEADAMESVPDEDIAKICQEILSRFTNQCVPMPTKIIVSRWGSDPLNNGSYSYIRPGNASIDCDRLAAPLPEVGNPKLMFAGEATNAKQYATTHGALLSGEREANRILRHISQK